MNLPDRFLFFVSRPEGPVQAKIVEETFVNTGRILNLHVGDQVIRTTPEHPLYVRDKGWLPAGELLIGDLLSGADDQWLPVEDLFDTGDCETVYNLRVADYHTYFVGQPDWGFSIWAHNSYSKSVSPEVRQQAVEQAWREEAEMIRRTGRGTRRWTDPQKRELLETGRVRRYQGHHINSVNESPLFAGLSGNIEFLTRVQHFKKHGENWQNPTTGPLLGRTTAEALHLSVPEEPLTHLAVSINDSDVIHILASAKAKWSEIQGEKAIPGLSHVKVQIVDLAGSLLGLADDDIIWIDVNAAGYGWFVDSTPEDDSEFNVVAGKSELHAEKGAVAYGRVDLLTVLVHELGHVLGYAHSAENEAMGETLGLGVRHSLGCACNACVGQVQTIPATVGLPLDPLGTTLTNGSQITHPSRVVGANDLGANDILSENFPGRLGDVALGHVFADLHRERFLPNLRLPQGVDCARWDNATGLLSWPTEAGDGGTEALLGGDGDDITVGKAGEDLLLGGFGEQESAADGQLCTFEAHDGLF